MTNEEAIQELDSRKLTMSMCIDIESCIRANKAIELAISALEENDKLKAEIEQLKSRTCQSCVNKGKCAIFDNFNIDYCSDWEKGKVEE